MAPSAAMTSKRKERKTRKETKKPKHAQFPNLLAPADDTNVEDKTVKVTAFDTRNTKYIADCTRSITVTLCSMKTTKEDYLCLSQKDKASGECHVEYVRQKSHRAYYNEQYYFHLAKDDESSNTFVMKNISTPVRISYLPSNTSQLIFHDILGDFDFKNTELPPDVKTLTIMHTDLEAYPSETFDNLTLPTSIVRVNLTNTALESFDASGWKDTDMTELFLDYNALTMIGPVSFPRKLRTLSLVNNNLTDQSFNGTTFPKRLKEIYLGYNRISSLRSIPMSNLSKLELLGITHNEGFTTLDKAAAEALPPSLITLDLSESSITAISPDFYFPPSLRVLRLSDNKLDSFPPTLQLPSTLQEFYLDGNPITNFQVSNETFQVLNRLTVLDVDLQNITCGGYYVKKAVGNSSYVCVEAPEPPATTETPATTDPPTTYAIKASAPQTPVDVSRTSSSMPAGHVVLIAIGAVCGVMLAVLAYIYVGRRRRRASNEISTHDFIEKSTPSTNGPQQVSISQSRSLPRSASSSVLTDLATFDVAADIANDPSVYLATYDGVLNTASSGPTTLELPPLLADNSALTKLAIPAQQLENVEPFRGSCEAATWNRRAIVLKPFVSQDPITSLTLYSSVTHPHIVLLYGVTWNSSDELKLVVERLGLGSLHSILFETPMQLSLAEKVTFASDAATGLLYLHSNDILHLDLTDKHVFVSDELTAKIGLPANNPKTRAELRSAKADQLVWIAPELLSSSNAPTAAADVYSLGVLLSMLERGSLPSESDTSQRGQSFSFDDFESASQVSGVDPSDVTWFSPECPDKLRKFGMSCLQWAPSDRPSALDAAYTLRQLGQELAAEADE